MILLLIPLAVSAQTVPEASRWTATLLSEVKGFAVPECVLPDPERKQVFVSNIESTPEEYWADDLKGFISLLELNGTSWQTRWLDSSPDALIHSPKGMCILKDNLYFTDNASLKRCMIAGPGALVTIALPKTERLNDLATDSENIYVSDIALNLVYKVAADGSVAEIPSPKSPNGITCAGSRVFAVSWDLHEAYELDPSGKNAPMPFGLAEHFTNLDGIEALDDGTLLVSDFMGNKISAIAPDHKTVYTLIELESPADIGLDRTRGILYVPQFMIDKVLLLQLKAPVGAK
jgi:DNA-binding beta-propeller fold protein YncE